MLSFLRKQKLKDKEMRILILGLDSAGKTTIVKRLMGEDVYTASPTLGFIIKTYPYIDKKDNGQEEIYRLNIWDVGGQKTLRSYWRNYFEKTDALIWVVDAADQLRMGECKESLHGLLQEERLMGASLLVFANKIDIRNSMTVEEIWKALDLKSIQTHTCNIMPCSAITGENVKKGIEWVVEDAKDKMFLY